jgi:hypothetical protein
MQIYSVFSTYSAFYPLNLVNLPFLANKKERMRYLIEHEGLRK